MEKIKYIRLIAVALIVVILDQLTKYWVSIRIEPGTYIYPEPIPIIKNFFYLVHIHNTGAAWGTFSGGSLWLGILALLVIGSFFLFRKHLELERPAVQLIMGLLIGGIIGNLIDRFYRGYVIDFIDIHLPGYRWPAFNIADSAICIAVVLYILITILDFSKKEPKVER